MDAIKTAYSTAYERLVLLAKSGKIGKVVSVDAVCTSLRDGISIAGTDLTQKWNSMCGWAPAALLPVFLLRYYRAHFLVQHLGHYCFQIETNI